MTSCLPSIDPGIMHMVISGASCTDGCQRAYCVHRNPKMHFAYCEYRIQHTLDLAWWTSLHGNHLPERHHPDCDINKDISFISCEAWRSLTLRPECQATSLLPALHTVNMTSAPPHDIPLSPHLLLSTSPPFHLHILKMSPPLPATLPAGPYVIRNQHNSTVLHIQHSDALHQSAYSIQASHQNESQFKDQQIWWVEPLADHDSDSTKGAVYSICSPGSGKVLEANPESGIARGGWCGRRTLMRCLMQVGRTRVGTAAGCGRGGDCGRSLI